MKTCSFLILIIFFPLIILGQETEAEKEARMKWFAEARLGVFIHWGIYSVKGVDESWSFYNRYLPYEEYMKQTKGFTASKYDPESWASLIKESGARYAVLTTKHHDGVALFDTKQSDLNVIKKTPAAKDLVKPFCDALRKQGIKNGLYFSMLDWSHPDYPKFLNNQSRYENDPIRWNRFLEFRKNQIHELAAYQPDLLWFDGDWDYNADEWKSKEMRNLINEWMPGVIVNSRINGYGDYATPEQGVPLTSPNEPYWELCMTMNDSWGFQPNDKNYKSSNQVIRIFTDCISMGGNLLLDIGPKPDGTIPSEQVAILKALGRWTNKHAEAIFGTQAGIPKDYFYGPTALSKDSTTLYLFITNKPNGPLMIKGLKNPVNRVWVVGNGTKLKTEVMMKSYWSEVPGILYIDLPEESLDEEVTVVAVLLKGKIDLWPTSR
ncbi:MAG: alpha-L-fucosidase [Bacteroidales bacterium]|nr:alpha-L-fucosidase [Bacteroidales bacterium]